MEKGPPPADGDQSARSRILGTHAFLTVIAIVAVSFRFLARSLGYGAFGKDDWLMLLALVSASTSRIFSPPQLTISQFCACINFGLKVALVDAGYGRHAYFLRLDQLIRASQLLFFSEFLSLLAVCFVKISITLFLLRITGMQKRLKVLLIATVALLVTSTIAFVVILFVQCRPITVNWNLLSKKSANCLPASSLAVVSYCTTGLSTT